MLTNSEVLDKLKSVLAKSKVDSEGRVTITLSEVSDLLGISTKLLFRPRVLCKKLLVSGFEMHSLTDDSDIPQWVVICMMEYFAYESKTPNEYVLNLFRTFTAIGYTEVSLMYINKK